MTVSYIYVVPVFLIILVLISIASEMSTHWAPLARKCATHNNWVQDCKDPTHWARYTEECVYHTTTHHSSFWIQWVDAVLRNVKWCGIDKCEALFSLQRLVMGFMAISLFKAVPFITSSSSSSISTSSPN